MVRAIPTRPYDRKQRSCRRGVAAVEFALIAPVMFLITFGMIEIGSVMMIKNALTQASRIGARAGSLPMSTSEGIYAKVREELQLMNLEHAAITIHPEVLASIPPGGNVTVKVSIDPSTVGWVPQFLKLPLTAVVAQTTMRREST
ncbi:MAG TPA: pilus assembly protein TadE [Planctomycetaceae bacterium]|nr:pilus assembly protein TadE [Planctomycetaceae bacterium]